MCVWACPTQATFKRAGWSGSDGFSPLHRLYYMAACPYGARSLISLIRPYIEEITVKFCTEPKAWWKSAIFV